MRHFLCHSVTVDCNLATPWKRASVDRCWLCKASGMPPPKTPDVVRGCAEARLRMVCVCVCVPLCACASRAHITADMTRATPQAAPGSRCAVPPQAVRGASGGKMYKVVRVASCGANGPLPTQIQPQPEPPRPVQWQPHRAP